MVNAPSRRWVVFVIAGRKQGGRVGFKQAVTDGDGRHTHIDDSGVMTGPGHQRIANRQHDSAQHDDTLGTQHFITQPAANGDEAINQRAKGGEQSNGISFRHTQLFYQIYWGVFGAQSRWTAAFIVILGGKTASNVHYPGASGKAFVIICYT